MENSSKRYTAVLVAVLVLASACASFAQGSGCENGIVQLPAGINGKITLCSALASQMPKVIEELNFIHMALADQQKQAEEMRRMLEKVNRVSRQMSAAQQADMVRNVSSRLVSSGSQGRQPLGEDVSALNEQLGTLQGQLLDVAGERNGPARLSAAMKGDLGTSISHLDFKSAMDQLDSIARQLREIGADVKDIQSKVDDLHQHDKRREAEELEAKLHADAQVKADHARELADADRFVRLGLMLYSRSSSPSTSSTMNINLYHDLGGGRLQNPEFFVKFEEAGKQPWLLKLPSSAVADNTEIFTTKLAQAGATALACYAADDPRTNSRRYWHVTLVRKPDAQMGVIAMFRYSLSSVPVLSEVESSECKAARSLGINNAGQIANETASLLPEPRQVLYFRIPPTVAQHTHNTPLSLIAQHSWPHLSEPAIKIIFRRSDGWQRKYELSLPPEVQAVEYWRWTVDEVGEKMTVCYSVLDGNTSKRYYWRQLFQGNNVREQIFTTFQPQSEPVLALQPSPECR